MLACLTSEAPRQIPTACRPPEQGSGGICVFAAAAQGARFASHTYELPLDSSCTGKVPCCDCQARQRWRAMSRSVGRLRTSHACKPRSRPPDRPASLPPHLVLAARLVGQHTGVRLQGGLGAAHAAAVACGGGGGGAMGGRVGKSGGSGSGDSAAASSQGEARPLAPWLRPAARQRERAPGSRGLPAEGPATRGSAHAAATASSPLAPPTPLTGDDAVGGDVGEGDGGAAGVHQRAKALRAGRRGGRGKWVGVACEAGQACPKGPQGLRCPVVPGSVVQGGRPRWQLPAVPQPPGLWQKLTQKGPSRRAGAVGGPRNQRAGAAGGHRNQRARPGGDGLHAGQTPSPGRPPTCTSET